MKLPMINCQRLFETLQSTLIEIYFNSIGCDVVTHLEGAFEITKWRFEWHMRAVHFVSRSGECVQWEQTTCKGNLPTASTAIRLLHYKWRACRPMFLLISWFPVAHQFPFSSNGRIVSLKQQFYPPHWIFLNLLSFGLFYRKLPPGYHLTLSPNIMCYKKSESICGLCDRWLRSPWDDQY